MKFDTGAQRLLIPVMLEAPPAIRPTLCHDLIPVLKEEWQGEG